MFIPILMLIFIYVFIYLNFKNFFFKIYINKKQKSNYIFKNFYLLSKNIVYNNILSFVFNYFYIIVIFYFFFVSYYFNYLSNNIFLSFQLQSYVLFYYKILLILFFVSFSILKNNFNNVKNYETLVSYFFFFYCLFYYLSVNNLITLIFIFEFQSIIFIYLLSNLFYLKSNYLLNKTLKTPIWYFNSLLYQFWISFLGALILVYSLLIFLKNIFFVDWINVEIFLYFLNSITFYSKKLDIILIFLPLIMGFMLKLGLFPFFFWKPEIYKNFNLDTIFLYMTVYVFSTSYFIIFFITTYFFLVNSFIYIYLDITIIISLIFLPIIFYSVVEIRTFLAYTYIFHMLIILISTFFNNLFYSTSFIYLMTYIFFSFNFIILLYYISNYNLWFFTDFQFFFKNNLVNLVIFNLFLGMSGIPPFLGFFSKLSIISLLIFYENYFLFFLFFISGLIISFYYIQNYRFFGYNLKSINYSKNYFLIKLNFKYLNYLLFFISFNTFSFIFFNELFIFSLIFKIS